MRDAARAAAMSDPEQNQWFRRRWDDTVARNCPTRSSHSAPSQLFHGTQNSLDLFGRELLAAWRRERAAHAGQSGAGCITVRGGR